MSNDQLRAEFVEYHQRIEEVLSGMDRVLSDLQRRLAALEKRVDVMAACSPAAGGDLRDRLQELDDQMGTLAAVVQDLVEVRMR